MLWRRFERAKTLNLYDEDIEPLDEDIEPLDEDIEPLGEEMDPLSPENGIESEPIDMAPMEMPM